MNGYRVIHLYFLLLVDYYELWKKKGEKGCC